ncbi:MAG: sulfotransferase family 2 domain-containing protein [Gemmatimonadota bacterium]
MRSADRMVALRYPVQRAWARFKTRYLLDYTFVHINKTGGSSIEQALGMPFQHRTALELRELIGDAAWDRRFSFAFVRNPWDKAVSHYHYRVKTGQMGLGDTPVPFDEWVIRAYGEHDPAYYDQPRMFMPQYQWLSGPSGNSMVDFVGRFERLHDDFAEVCRRIDVDASLPHLKKSKHRDYRDLYSTECRDVIARVFEGDLERYDYEFG